MIWRRKNSHLSEENFSRVRNLRGTCEKNIFHVWEIFFSRVKNFLPTGENFKPSAGRGFSMLYGGFFSSCTQKEQTLLLELCKRHRRGQRDIQMKNVLSNFVDRLLSYLRDGFSVQLSEFGTMRLTLSSEGSLTEKVFKTETNKFSCFVDCSWY